MQPIEFENRMVVTGFGIVAQAALPMLLEHVRIPLDRITVIDISDRTEALKPWLGPGGLRFLRERVTATSLPRLLSGAVGRGGLILDLAWSIDFFDIAEWAHNNGVLYVNASMESWDPTAELHAKSLLDKSMYKRYAKALDLASAWRGGTTAVFDHGVNPGLISSFVKKALLDIGDAVLHKIPLAKEERERLEQRLEARDFPELSRELGVRVIHCSEYDTQRAAHTKSADEFVGTWSVEGMWEECVAPCELGWGTHEQSPPPLAVIPNHGPGNMLLLPQMGMNTWIRSWVPHQQIVGMLITHGECFGVSHALTIRSGENVLYRPTVLYAYLPCGESIQSLHELRCRNYEIHPSTRILAREIRDGSDSIGALVMGHAFQSWWTGTILSIEEARQKVPAANATAVQVAAGMVAAVLWAIRNPRQGLCFPEDLPHEEILRVAEPYLGHFTSEPVDWNPLGGRRTFFPENPAAKPNWDDPWQFDNFLFTP